MHRYIVVDYDADFYDETLEFQPDTEEWSLASRIIEARVGQLATHDNYYYPELQNNAWGESWVLGE